MGLALGSPLVDGGFAVNLIDSSIDNLLLFLGVGATKDQSMGLQPCIHLWNSRRLHGYIGSGF